MLHQRSRVRLVGPLAGLGPTSGQLRHGRLRQRRRRQRRQGAKIPPRTRPYRPHR